MKDPNETKNDKDIENQQHYSALPTKVCDEINQASEAIPQEWATLGASYLFFHKLLLVIYLAFIILTVYNTIDVVRNRNEGE
jgi:hypothetical protein